MVWTGGRVDRRWVLTGAGRGVVGFALLGLVGCSSDSDSGGSPAVSPGPDSSDGAEGSSAPGGGLAWDRVDLGFVSAYVLVRGREAAVVDTGVGGSADAIGDVLDRAGPGWAGVRHVVLTHKHPDHAGSVGDVLTSAEGAQGYVGTKDLPDVDAPRALRGLDDGDEVFGLRVVASPGHTLGHICVFDPDTSVLVAGDALTNQDGLAGSNPQFTEDEDAAAASVRTLAALRPRTILVGHGPPLTSAAADALDRLASA